MIETRRDVGVRSLRMAPLRAVDLAPPFRTDNAAGFDDWMMNTFFIFSGLAVLAFVAAWKAGHFHDLDRLGSLPLLVEEEDYYTPEWALDEEEWADGDA